MPNQSHKQIWLQVLEAVEVPSTRMLLSQQAKLKSLHSQGILFLKTYQAEVEVSENWIGMLQSRKYIVEDAFSKVLNGKTQVCFSVDTASSIPSIEKPDPSDFF